MGERDKNFNPNQIDIEDFDNFIVSNMTDVGEHLLIKIDKLSSKNQAKLFQLSELIYNLENKNYEIELEITVTYKNSLMGSIKI